MSDAPAPIAPVIDPGTAPYWAALGEGRLLLKTCNSCGKAHFYPREACPHCWSDDLGWREASGGGEVYSMTTIHRAPGPAYAAQVPYVIAIVALNEGPRMLTWLRAAPGDVKIGIKVKFLPEPLPGGEMKMPLFRLDEPS